MFKEIAIEPAAIVGSYRDFAYIIEKFGVHEGRLIAAFPSKWKRFVFHAAQERLHGKVELARLEVRLRALKDDMFYWRGRSGDGCAQDWLGTAIAEHARVPFDAIIAVAPSLVGGVVAADDLDGLHACLQPNRQWHIDRDASVMALCCEPLLSSARHIKLIDPHFDLSQARFRRPFLEFLKCARPGTRVDVFRGDNHGADFAAQRLTETLDAIQPDGIQVQVFFQPQDTMHNRFVLTEAGGVYFLTGLDDKGNGDLSTDEVGVLDPDVWAIQWGRFSDGQAVAVWPK